MAVWKNEAIASLTSNPTMWERMATACGTLIDSLPASVKEKWHLVIAFVTMQHHLPAGYRGKWTRDSDDSAELSFEDCNKSISAQSGHLRSSAWCLLHRKFHFFRLIDLSPHLTGWFFVCHEAFHASWSTSTWLCVWRSLLQAHPIPSR